MKANLRRNLIQTSLLAAVVLALPAVLQAQFNYTTDNGTITITSYTGPGGAVTIPATINGLPVTSIGDQAFFDCITLTSVTIGNSVVNIGNEAFAKCFSLTNVLIGSSVSNIGYYAFDECTSLASVKIPNCVTNIGYFAFEDCTSLTSVTIPDSVVSLGLGVFGNCTGLTDVTIGDSVTNIGIFEFAYCGKLASVTIGQSVTVIEGGAFEECTNLTSITIPDSVINVPEWVGALSEAGAFTDCTSLTNVTIGSNVTNIGGLSFAGCTSLKTITIPASVTSIDAYPDPLSNPALFNCSTLTNIYVDPLNPAYSSLDGVLFDKSQTTLIQFPGGRAGSYRIPDSVTTIASEAFADSADLVSVTIGGNITDFGWAAFDGCTRLTGGYFLGDAPDSPYVTPPELYNETNAIVYYLPGKIGWGPTFGDRPTALWLPQAQTGGASFGVRTNQFGFNIAWAIGQTVVVEACTNLANPVWTSVATNTLAGDSSYFSDPQSSNYPARFYRLRSP